MGLYRITQTVSPPPLSRLSAALSALPRITPRAPDINALVEPDINALVEQLVTLVNQFPQTKKDDRTIISEEILTLHDIRREVKTLAAKEESGGTLDFEKDVRPIALDLSALSDVEKYNKQALAALTVIDKMGDILDPVKKLVKTLDKLVRAWAVWYIREDEMAVREAQVHMEAMVRGAKSPFILLTYMEYVKPMLRLFRGIKGIENEEHQKQLQHILRVIEQLGANVHFEEPIA